MKKEVAKTNRTQEAATSPTKQNKLSKLLVISSNSVLNILNPLLKKSKVILQSQLLVLDDPNQFDKLVVFLFLLTNVFFAK